MLACIQFSMKKSYLFILFSISCPKLPDFIKFQKHPRAILLSISISYSLWYNYHHRDLYKACGPECHLGHHCHPTSLQEIVTRTGQSRGKWFLLNLSNWLLLQTVYSCRPHFVNNEKNIQKTLKYLIHNILRKMLKCHLIVKDKTQWNWWTQKFDMKLILFLT
jgi:hypothetical protein